MARVTVEDCVEKVPNRFDLVMLSARRARDVADGAPITVDRDNDKNPVVALREVADGTIGVEELREHTIQAYQRHIEVDEPEEDNMALLMGEGEGGQQMPSTDDLDEERLLRALMAEQDRK